MLGHKPEVPKGLRIIKTVRGEAAINRAAKEGFFPLVKEIVPSPKIRNKYRCFQHEETEQIEIVYDYRSFPPKRFQLLFEEEF